MSFVKAEKGLLLLQVAAAGQKFSKRPSKLLGILDESIALDFDITAAVALQRHEDERAKDLADLTARLTIHYLAIAMDGNQAHDLEPEPEDYDG